MILEVTEVRRRDVAIPGKPLAVAHEGLRAVHRRLRNRLLSMQAHDPHRLHRAQDRPRVRENALRQKSSRAMLESSLEMARKLQIPAVAEGVEKQAEWDLLRTLGCDLAQGFLIAHTPGGIGFLEWLRQCKRSP